MSGAKVVRCACQWVVAAIDLASAINAAILHSEASGHPIDDVSIFAFGRYPAINPKERRQMVKTQKKPTVKTWWQLSELEKAIPGVTEKLAAYWEAQRPPVTSSSPAEPKAKQRDKAQTPAAPAPKPSPVGAASIAAPAKTQA